MNAPVQKKWRDCVGCGKGFKQPTSEPPAKLCPTCRKGNSGWDATDEANHRFEAAHPDHARDERMRREAFERQRHTDADLFGGNS